MLFEKSTFLHTPDGGVRRDHRDVVCTPFHYKFKATCAALLRRDLGGQFVNHVTKPVLARPSVIVRTA